MLAMERYTLGKPLGQGGFGAVLEALDHYTGGTVAVKELLRLSDDSVLRFKREFRMLSELSHRNLVNYHELIHQGDHWWLVMDVIDGLMAGDYVRFGMIEDIVPMPKSSGSFAGASTMPVGIDGIDTVEGVEGVDGGKSRDSLLSATPSIESDPDTEQPITTTENHQAKPDPIASMGFSRHEHISYDKPSKPEVVEHKNKEHRLPPLDTDEQFTRLRSVIRQAVRGLRFLHANRLVHRDIKPSNLLVDETGRLVILDFGLAYYQKMGDNDARAPYGTPPYMSPELLAGKPVTAAADWYALGVMIYEIVTGRKPYKVNRQPGYIRRVGTLAPPRHFAPDIPDDINAVIEALLVDDPDQRGDADVVRGLLEDELTSGSAVVPELSDRCLGRSDELGRLRQAWQRVVDYGRPETVLVEGPSGYGKSTVINTFYEEVQQLPSVLILAGTCYQHERLPFKLLDQVVESLAEALIALPQEQRLHLIPRDVGWLARLFPRFNQLAGDITSGVAEEFEVQRRGFQALRQLLQNVSRTFQLLLTIDNVHWGDFDSIRALESVFTDPGAPPLMLLLSARDSEGQDVTQALNESLLRQHVGLTHIDLGPVPDEALQMLLDSFSPERQQKILAQVQGNPLLLRRLLSRPDLLSDRLSLHDILLTQLEALPERVAYVLQAVVISGQARSIPFYRQLFEQDGVSDWGEALRLLLAEQLLREIDLADTRRLVPYHDKVSEVYLQFLDESIQRKWHQRFARALADRPQEEAEALGRHWLALNEPSRAVQHFSEAAVQAERLLAFDRAADLLAQIMDVGVDGQQHSNLLLRRGQALENAGRGLEAAQCYRLASEQLTGAFADKALLAAASNLLRAGSIDDELDRSQEALWKAGYYLGQ